MSIHLKIGPMYSSKTRSVMEEVIKATIALQTAVLIRHARDTRYAKKSLAVSHDGSSMTCIVAHNLHEDPPGLPADVKVVAIDEGQFFEGLVEFCVRMVSVCSIVCALTRTQIRRGVTVYVAALNSNFRLEMWENIVRLIPIASTVQLYRGVCILCQGDATCSRRITNDTEETLVGADESYVATCFPCFEKPIGQDILSARAAALDKARSMTGKSP
jgi:thymidine kinase